MSARFAAIFLACLTFAPEAFAASPPASSPALWGDLLPPDASAILGELATGDDEARWRAEVRLVELGEAALPALLQLAGSDDPRVRDAVASVLLGMGEEGALPVNRAVADALVALIRGEGEAGKTAREAFLQLGEAGGRHAIPPLIGLLRETDPHTDREIRAMARTILEGVAGRDHGPDAQPWADWWGGEEKRYLERERVRSLPFLTADAVERASQTARTGSKERVRILRGDLYRRRQGPPIPRGGRWLLELALDIDAPIWPWGLFPARVWFRQKETQAGGRFLPALDLKDESSSLRAVAVAPALLDPGERTEVVVQMVDARDGSDFLLVLRGVRFREER